MIREDDTGGYTLLLKKSCVHSANTTVLHSILFAVQITMSYVSALWGTREECGENQMFQVCTEGATAFKLFLDVVGRDKVRMLS